MNELFTIPNLQANLVEKKAVWDQTFEIPEFETTAQFKNWAAEPDTNYCAFSTFEGLDSSQRVSGNNSPHFIHGVVLDYDAKFSDDEVGEFVSRSLESAYPMSYVSRSYSGGIHAVWFFEKPVMFHGKKVAKRFLDLSLIHI